MERLEAKLISGRTYYYYSRWAWVNGKCRRVWQKYLGTMPIRLTQVGALEYDPAHVRLPSDYVGVSASFP